MKVHLAVVAALIRENDKVLICQRKADDCFALLWEFPGGKVETGETYQQAIIREIKEELGVDIQADNSPLAVFEDENEELRITVYLFKTRIKEGVLIPRDCHDFKMVKINDLRNFNLAPVDIKIAAYLSRE
ncbi:MAG: (deoxy)nucleoside triphosphate pyrophosphohydrolase [Candidatus Omnitrophica bacterium]|nr:(deoxy)nucleoside triphosphate pyrophosphohydrolase [Candidatus Omnitrophota bacterium]